MKMLARLWLSVCVLASLDITSAHLGSTPLDTRTNGDRARRGLPLKNPPQIGTPRYQAIHPRASSNVGSQNTVIQATMGDMRRRAGETYLAFDSGKNGFVITSDVSQASTFAVPASTSGLTQVRIYTSDGLYYLGASGSGATTTSSSFLIRGTNTSDLGSPSDSQIQTTIWSFAGIPGALTGSFSALGSSYIMYLSADSDGHLIGSSSPPDAARRVSLSLVDIGSLGASIRTVAAPSDSGIPPTAPNVDPGLTTVDTALNAGAGDDEEALLKLIECLSGPDTPECEALLATLTPPTPP